MEDSQCLSTVALPHLFPADTKAPGFPGLSTPALRIQALTGPQGRGAEAGRLGPPGSPGNAAFQVLAAFLPHGLTWQEAEAMPEAAGSESWNLGLCPLVLGNGSE